MKKEWYWFKSNRDYEVDMWRVLFMLDLNKWCPNSYTTPCMSEIIGWTCRLTNEVNIQFCKLGFGLDFVYYDGHHFSLKLGFIRINWSC